MPRPYDLFRVSSVILARLSRYACGCCIFRCWITWVCHLLDSQHHVPMYLRIREWSAQDILGDGVPLWWRERSKRPPSGLIQRWSIQLMEVGWFGVQGLVLWSSVSSPRTLALIDCWYFRTIRLEAKRHATSWSIIVNPSPPTARQHKSCCARGPSCPFCDPIDSRSWTACMACPAQSLLGNIGLAVLAYKRQRSACGQRARRCVAFLYRTFPTLSWGWGSTVARWCLVRWSAPVAPVSKCLKIIHWCLAQALIDPVLL